VTGTIRGTESATERRDDEEVSRTFSAKKRSESEIGAERWNETDDEERTGTEEDGYHRAENVNVSVSEWETATTAFAMES
jgi:hypothetical protein